MYRPERTLLVCFTLAVTACTADPAENQTELPGDDDFDAGDDDAGDDDAADDDAADDDAADDDAADDDAADDDGGLVDDDDSEADLVDAGLDDDEDSPLADGGMGDAGAGEPSEDDAGPGALAPDLTGSWRVTATVAAPHPFADVYPGVWTLIDNRDGTVEGTGLWAPNSGNARSNFTGTLSGASIHLDRLDLTGFVGAFDGTVSTDGQQISGEGANDPGSPMGNDATYTWTAIRLPECDDVPLDCLDVEVVGAWQCPSLGAELSISATGRVEHTNSIGQHSSGCMSCDGAFETVSMPDSMGSPSLFVYVNGSFTVSDDAGTLGLDYCIDTSDLDACREAPGVAGVTATCERMPE